jgi:hypothetical protein
MMSLFVGTQYSNVALHRQHQLGIDRQIPTGFAKRLDQAHVECSFAALAGDLQHVVHRRIDGS